EESRAGGGLARHSPWSSFGDRLCARPPGNKPHEPSVWLRGKAQRRNGRATKPQAQRMPMIVQTTLVHGASLPYAGLCSYRMDMLGSRLRIGSIGPRRAPASMQV